nr:MAG TPA: hypothetical protein [Caudoviricetes sp.]
MFTLCILQTVHLSPSPLQKPQTITYMFSHTCGAKRFYEILRHLCSFSSAIK